MPIPSQLTAQETLQSYARALEKLNATSLSFKIRKLRQTRSDDPVQQMQTDAIVELYDAVREIQEALWPMLITIPDVSGARDAAQQAGSGQASTAPAPTLTTARMQTGSFFRAR